MSRPKSKAKPRPVQPARVAAPPPPAPAPAPEPEEPQVPLWLRLCGLGVASVAAFVLAIVCAFYTPLRIGSVLVPVSLVLVVAGLAGILRFAHRITANAWLSLVPGGVWLVISLILSSPTHEGDLVLGSSDWVAPVYLIVGCVTIGVTGYRVLLSGFRPPLDVHSRREPPLR